MMVVWPKHVVAITLEKEKKNCWVDGTIIALLILGVCILLRVWDQGEGMLRRRKNRLVLVYITG
jgi:hypothetical protein